MDIKVKKLNHCYMLQEIVCPPMDIQVKYVLLLLYAIIDTVPTYEHKICFTMAICYIIDTVPTYEHKICFNIAI